MGEGRAEGLGLSECNFDNFGEHVVITTLFSTAPPGSTTLSLACSSSLHRTPSETDPRGPT